MGTKKTKAAWIVEKKLIPFDNFFFNGVNAGIKDKTLDLALATCSLPTKAAALFTKNIFPGAPLVVAKKDVFSKASPKVKAILVNSKNANVFTGKAGEDDVRTILQSLQKKLSLPSDRVVMSSTGIIGKKLPKHRILNKIDVLCKGLKNTTAAQLNFAKAILTTDSKAKFASAICYGSNKKSIFKILGIAKGAGMVEPNMATMLVYIFTNVKLKGSTPLKKYLVDAANNSFQCLSIDGDTSTSDTVLLVNDESSTELLAAKDFQKGLTKVCVNLTQQIVRDGEGKHKAIHLILTGASTNKQADAFAKSILNSLLVKTALHGGDPNWGRLVMAVGKVPGYKLSQDNFFVRFFTALNEDYFSVGDKERKAAHQLNCSTDDFVEINSKNFESEAVLKKAAKKMQQNDIYMEVCIGKGEVVKNYWGNALGEDYVRFNSTYTT